jgi:hypothetical protein
MAFNVLNWPPHPIPDFQQQTSQGGCERLKIGLLTCSKPSPFELLFSGEETKTLLSYRFVLQLQRTSFQQRVSFFCVTDAGLSRSRFFSLSLRVHAFFACIL